MSSSLKKLTTILLFLVLAGGFVLAVNKYSSDTTRGNEPRLVFEEARQWQIASDAVTTYHFLTCTTGTNCYGEHEGVDDWASDGAIGVGTGKTPSDTAAQITYTNVVSENSTPFVTLDPGNFDEPVAEFFFNLAENENSVTQLDLRFVGYDTSSGTVTFRIWNYSTLAWETLSSGSGATYFALTGSKTTNLANYIGSVTPKTAGAPTFSNAVALSVDGTTSNEVMYLDYVKVDVTYNLPITVSGVVYLADETTLATSANGGPCDGTTAIVKAVVNNGTPSTAVACNGTTAAFSVTTSSGPVAGDTITLFLTSSAKANLVYTSDGTADTGMNLYIDRVATSHLNGSSITIADMVDYDSTTNPTDMLYDAVSGTPNNLTIASGKELHIVQGKTFLPGGSVTTQGGGGLHLAYASVTGAAANFGANTVVISGNVTIDANTTLTAPSTTLNIAGNYSNSGTFTHNSGTVTFNGVATQTITGATTWNNLTINNSAGDPSTAYVSRSAAQTVSNTLTVTDGQYMPDTGDSYMDVSIGANGILKPVSASTTSVGGSWTNSGTFTANGGTVTFGSGWSYKKQITVNNQVASALTNYQVKIIVDPDTGTDGTPTDTVWCNGKCQTAGATGYGDIRFTDADGNQIDYWIEDATSNPATFWVEVPSIPASSTAVIYMLYGNAGATTTSNGANTFIQYHGPASATFYDELVAFNNIICEAKIKNTAASSNILAGVTSGTDNRYHLFMQSYNPANNRAYSTQNNFVQTYTNTVPAMVNGVYETQKIISAGGTNVYHYTNNILKASHTTNIPTSNMGLFLFIVSGSGLQDYSFIRKYAATEPTKTWGSETTRGLSGTMTGASSFNNLVFNDSGTGAAWTFGANSATVANDFTITAGAVTAPSTTLTIAGNYSNSGTFTHNSGTVTFNGSATQAISGSSTAVFNNLIVTNTAAAVSSSVNFDVVGTLNMNGASAVLTPAAAVIINDTTTQGILTGTGTVQVTKVSGTNDFASQYEFTTKTLANLTVDFIGATTGQQVDALTYYNLNIGDSGTTANYTAAGNITVSNVLTIVSSTGANTFSASSYTITLSGSGTPFVIGTNGLFGYDTSTLKYTSSSDTYITETEYYNLKLGPGS